MKYALKVDMLQIFIMYALFGSIFAVGKISMIASQPYFFTAIRMLLAGVLLLCFLGQKGLKSISLPKKTYPLLFLVAFFNVFITNAFEFWGLQYMEAGKTCLIYSLSPFAAALIAYFFGTETMTSKKWWGLAIGISSFIPIMIGPWLSSQSVNTMELLAEGALMISAVTAMIGWTFFKKLLFEHQLSHALINGASFLLAGIMSLMTSFFLEDWNPVPVSLWKEFLWTVLYVVLIHNIICYSIYASSLNRFSVTFMAFIGLSNPFFAAFFGFIFLGETIELSFALAFIGVIIGLYLYYKEEKANEPLNA